MTSWRSITGQALDLDPPNGFLGRCRPLSSYEILNRLGEGTYGLVSRARCKETSEIVALKQIRMQPHERHSGIPITALREISILRSLRHENIIKILEIAVGDSKGGNGDSANEEERIDGYDDVHMVMEYAQQDLAVMIDELRVQFSLSEIKCITKQLLEGIDYLHEKEIIHRDIKASNILLNSKGIIKLADFGMARAYSPRPLTPGVVTIWYRAPELLLGASRYGCSVDIWSVGLILGELILSIPLLQGESEIPQLSLITKLIGSPDTSAITALEAIGCPKLGSWRRETMGHGRPNNLKRRFEGRCDGPTTDFLGRFLEWDPKMRWTAREALGHGRSSWAVDAQTWWDSSPRAVQPSLLPTHPEVRNEEKRKQDLAYRSVKDPEDEKSDNTGFVFDLDKSRSEVERPAKRRRPK